MPGVVSGLASVLLTLCEHRMSVTRFVARDEASMRP